MVLKRFPEDFDTPEQVPAGTMLMGVSPSGDPVAIPADQLGGSGAAPLTVTLESYLLSNGNNPRLALEAASAAAKVVEIHGSYAFDAMATIANDTDVAGIGCLLSAVAGFTDRNLIRFAGSGRLRGKGTIGGYNLPAPTTNWAGGTETPIGVAIVAGTTTSANQGTIAGTVEVDGWTVMGCPGGAMFFARARGAVRNCRLGLNQTAAKQWKEIGQYFNVPTTNQGTSTAPIGEIIPSAVIEGYRCLDFEIAGNELPLIKAKGVSFSGTNIKERGNTYSGGTPRHAMLHFPDLAGFTSSDSTFDGLADRGDAIKASYTSGGSIKGHVITAPTIGIYLQDSFGITCDVTMVGVTVSAYYLQINGLTRSNVALPSMTGIVISGGIATCLGAGSAWLTFEVDTVAGSGATPRHIAVAVTGGQGVGAELPIRYATPNAKMAYDVAFTGGFAFIDCLSELYLIGRNVTFHGALERRTGLTGGNAAMRIGTVIGVPAALIDINATINGYAGLTAIQAGQGAALPLTVDHLSIVARIHGAQRAISWSVLGSDNIAKFFSIDIRATGLTGSGGQGALLEYHSKACRVQHKLVLIATDGTLLNAHVTGAGSEGSPITKGVIERGQVGAYTGGGYFTGPDMAIAA